MASGTRANPSIVALCFVSWIEILPDGSPERMRTDASLGRKRDASAAHRRRWVGLLAGLLFADTATAFGQAEQPLPAQLATMIASVGGIAPKQLAEVERGAAVVVSIDSPDHNEVALLGLVAVGVPRSFYVARAGELPAYLSGAGRSAVGVFHEPATAADLSALTLDPSDVSALQKCRPSHCQVKLPDAMMQRLKQSVDWSADRAAQVNALIRDWLAEVVNGYRARGDEALPVYDDTHVGERSADGFRQLLGEDAHLLDEAPTLAAYLRGTTTERIPGLETAIWWAIDDRPGLRPTLSVEHLATYSGSDPHAPTFIVTKQLYASHYFDAFLDVAALIDRASATVSSSASSGAGAGTYVLLLRRVRFDELPSGGLFNVRGRVIRKLRDGTRDELARTKQMMETAYEHHSSSTAPRTTSPPR